jgi:hypothetical protein
LGGKKAFMDRCKVFEDKAEPGVTVKDTIRGVESGREYLAKSVESSDSGPGQLRVRDVVVGEWCKDCERVGLGTAPWPN